MKRFFLLISAVFACGLISACSDSEDRDADTTVFASVTAYLPASTAVSWTNGAAFSLFSDIATDQIAGGRGFICTDCETQTFKGKISARNDRTKIYAIYPRQSGAYKTNFSVSVPGNQVQGDGSRYEILTASAHVDGNDFSSVTFRQLCAVWKVDFRNIVDEPKSVTGITLSCDEAVFPVSGTIASLDVPDFTAFVSQKTLTCEFSAPVASDGSTSFVMLPGEIGGKRVTVTLFCDDETAYSLEVTVPDDFGPGGSSNVSMLDMNAITPENPDEPGGEELYSRITSLDDFADGEYYIVSSVENAKTAKYDLMSNETQAFTYTADYGDANSTGKDGARFAGKYGADPAKWNPGDDAVWEFKYEAQFDMNAGSVINVKGWSIRNKESGQYLNLNNGQKLNTVAYVDNSVSGNNLLKQRWTLEVVDEVFKIRSIQNSGRYVRFYPVDGTFVLAGQDSAPTYNVYLYKKN